MSGQWINLEDHYARETKIGDGHRFLIREDIYPFGDEGADYYMDLYDFDSGQPPETILTMELSEEQVYKLGLRLK